MRMPRLSSEVDWRRCCQRCSLSSSEWRRTSCRPAPACRMRSARARRTGMNSPHRVWMCHIPSQANLYSISVEALEHWGVTNRQVHMHYVRHLHSESDYQEKTEYKQFVLARRNNDEFVAAVRRHPRLDQEVARQHLPGGDVLGASSDLGPRRLFVLVLRGTPAGRPPIAAHAAPLCKSLTGSPRLGTWCSFSAKYAHANV